MIETVVRYLHGAHVPFRLASHPSEEAAPKAAHAIPPHGVLVDARVLLVDGRAVLACFPSGEVPDLAAVGSTLGGTATEGSSAELPDEFARAPGPIPPLGQLFGLPLVVDSRVAQAGMLVFRAFDDNDFFEVPYDDFARLEQPRVASFSSVAELAGAER